MAAVKAEFGKFGDVLAKVHKKLREATNTIDQASVRTRAIERKLRAVEELPSGEVELISLDGRPAGLEEEDIEESEPRSDEQEPAAIPGSVHPR